jgi:Right handed beta helix region
MIGNQCFMNAQTPIQGIISKNLTLTEEGSPYRFGKTTIAAGVTLTIEAGVTLSVDFKNSGTTHDDGYTLLVHGRILAHGTAEKPIQIHGALRILRENSNITPVPAIFEYCHLDAPKTYGYILFSTIPIEMTNCTVEGIMYVQMGTNAGWNPEKTRFTRCKLSGNHALSLMHGAAVIEDCEIQGRCDAQVESLSIFNSDFKPSLSKSSNCALFLNAKRADVKQNTFEGINGAAIWVYYQPFNVMTIVNNTFKNNQIHLQIAVKTDLTHQKDLSTWTKNTLWIEENRFLKFEQNTILVTDFDNSPDRVATSTELDVKNNFWGGLTPLQMDDSIQDYADFPNLRLKINYFPISKK